MGNGFIASLAKPGGNITGMTTQHEDSMAKLIQVLHEAAPAARRIAVLLNESTPVHTFYWAGAQNGCAALGLEALRVAANVPAQLDGAVAQLVAKRAEAVVTIDAMHLSERVRLIELLRPTRLPVAAGFADSPGWRLAKVRRPRGAYSAPRCNLRRQDIEGRPPSRSAGPAADAVRAGVEPWRLPRRLA